MTDSLIQSPTRRPRTIAAVLLLSVVALSGCVVAPDRPAYYGQPDAVVVIHGGGHGGGYCYHHGC